MYEDMQFSFDRPKSFFLRSFCEWTTMILDVNLFFIRGLLCFM